MNDNRAGLLLILVLCAAWSTAGAQDLLITNAHIIDGAGNTIERGFVSIRDGRIA